MEDGVLIHCVLHFPPNSESIGVFSSETQRRQFPRHRSEIKIVNILISRVGIEATSCFVYSHHRPLASFHKIY